MFVFNCLGPAGYDLNYKCANLTSQAFSNFDEAKMCQGRCRTVFAVRYIRVYRIKNI